MTQGHSLIFAIVDEGEGGSLNISGAWLFHSQKEWEDAGKEFEKRGELYLSWPETLNGVDWKRDSVIVVSAGEFSSGPCRVRILAIQHHGQEARVDAEVEGPGSTQVVSTPWVVMTIDHKAIRTVAIAWR